MGSKTAPVSLHSIALEVNAELAHRGLADSVDVEMLGTTASWQIRGRTRLAELRLGHEEIGQLVLVLRDSAGTITTQRYLSDSSYAVDVIASAIKNHLCA